MALALWWLTFVLLCYLFVGYPLVIAIAARLFGRDVGRTDCIKDVAIVVAGPLSILEIVDEARMENAECQHSIRLQHAIYLRHGARIVGAVHQCHR